MRRCHLAHGGWFQQIELSVVPVFGQLGKVSLEAGDKFGKDLRFHEQIKGYLEGAGFEEVVQTIYKWPIGPRSKDHHIKLRGLWNLLYREEGIEGWSMALLTRVLGVSLYNTTLLMLEAYCDPYSGLTQRYKHT